eukprot:Hpha_TRINITY_DN31527_c0_g1::TRINITY_DN31527_c0_g1_i1::g.1694::m.1694
MTAGAKSFAQFHQDCAAVERFFWGVPNRTFIEIGGHDGLRLSNTKMLEDSLGWTGMIVEAHPDSYKQALVNRPRTHVFHAACADAWSSGGIVMQGYSGGDENVRSVSHIAGKERAKIQHNNLVAHNITAPLVTMGALTDRFMCGQRFHVDFMSLDVEGAELEVMLGFDWERVTIGVLLAETNLLSTEAKEKFDTLVLKKGQLKPLPAEPGALDTWYVSEHGAEVRRAKPDKRPSLSVINALSLADVRIPVRHVRQRGRGRPQPITTRRGVFQEHMGRPDGPCF